MPDGPAAEPAATEPEALPFGKNLLGITFISDDFYEDLDQSSTEALIDALARGETPPPGSATGRQGSAPEGGATTLKDLAFAKDSA